MKKFFELLKKELDLEYEKEKFRGNVQGCKLINDKLLTIALIRGKH